MKAICSKKNLNNINDKLVKEYIDCIKDIFYLDEVQNLNDFVQHLKTSRLQHSLNVSYYSFLWAKKRGLDYKSVARAGILHDLYLYDWKAVQTNQHHAFYHPKEALKNAKKLTKINQIEEDAIKNHMWPLSSSLPKFKESRILSWVDKGCTIVEVFHQISKKFKIKSYFKNNLLKTK